MRPAARPALPRTAQTLLAVERLEAIASDQENHRERALPLDEREARFLSMRGLRPVDRAGAPAGPRLAARVAEEVRREDPRYAGRRLLVCALPPASRDARIKAGDSLLALWNGARSGGQDGDGGADGGADRHDLLDRPWRRVLDLSFDQALRITRSRWWAGCATRKLLQVEVADLRTGDAPPLIVLAPVSEPHFALAEDLGLVDLDRPLVLDPVYEDHRSGRVEAVLRAIGGPPAPRPRGLRGRPPARAPVRVARAAGRLPAGDPPRGLRWPGGRGRDRGRHRGPDGTGGGVMPARARRLEPAYSLLHGPLPPPSHPRRPRPRRTPGGAPATPVGETSREGRLAGALLADADALPGGPLNPEQALALRRALVDPLLLLWGPPGTGKTRVLAATARAVVAAGRAAGRPARLLVATAAYAALDKLLGDVAGALEAPGAVGVGPLLPGVSLLRLAGRSARPLRDRRIRDAPRAGAAGVWLFTLLEGAALHDALAGTPERPPAPGRAPGRPHRRRLRRRRCPGRRSSAGSSLPAPGGPRSPHRARPAARRGRAGRSARGSTTTGAIPRTGPGGRSLPSGPSSTGRRPWASTTASPPGPCGWPTGPWSWGPSPGSSTSWPGSAPTPPGAARAGSTWPSSTRPPSCPWPTRRRSSARSGSGPGWSSRATCASWGRCAAWPWSTPPSRAPPVSLAPSRAAGPSAAPGARPALFESVFGYLEQTHGIEPLQLTRNYRTNEAIAAWPRRRFYGGRYVAHAPQRRLRLATPVPATHRPPAGWPAALPWSPRWAAVLDPGLPVVVLTYPGQQHALSNAFEARVVAALALLLRRHLPRLGAVSGGGDGEAGAGARAGAGAGEGPGRGGGVAAAVLGRAAGGRHPPPGPALADRQPAGRRGGLPRRPAPRVETVDAVQGQEREVVLASYCASDPDFIAAEAPFLLDPRRFNVTLTRARSKFVALMSDSLLRHLPADAEAAARAGDVQLFVLRYCRPVASFWVPHRDGARSRTVPVRLWAPAAGCAAGGSSAAPW